MGTDGDEQPQYTRYRARRRLLGGAGRDAPGAPRGRDARAGGVADPPRPAAPPPPGRESAPDAREIRAGGGGGGRPRTALGAGGWRRWATRKRIVLGLLGLLVGWVLFSVLLFLISSHFNRTAPQGDVAAVLDPAGNPLTSANNILVLGSDTPAEEQQGTGRGKDGAGPLGHDHADPHRWRSRRPAVDPA